MLPSQCLVCHATDDDFIIYKTFSKYVVGYGLMKVQNFLFVKLFLSDFFKETFHIFALQGLTLISLPFMSIRFLVKDCYTFSFSNWK